MSPIAISASISDLHKKVSGEFRSVKRLKAVSEQYTRYAVYAAEIRRLGMDGYVRMAMDNVLKELGYNVYGGVIVGTDEEGKPDGVTSRDYSLTDIGISGAPLSS